MKTGVAGVQELQELQNRAAVQVEIFLVAAGATSGFLPRRLGHILQILNSCNS
jgi:hypothetical protein